MFASFSNLYDRDNPSVNESLDAGLVKNLLVIWFCSDLCTRLVVVVRWTTLADIIVAYMFARCLCIVRALALRQREFEVYVGEE